MAWPAGEPSSEVVNSCLCFGGLHGHVERVDFEKAGSLVEEREAGVIVRDNGPERRNDAAKKSFDIASADEEIVDFEQDLQAIALKSELLLISLGGFKVERVVNGDGDLRGNALHEFDFGVAHAMRNVAAETDGAEAMLRGGQRNTGEGMDAFGLQALHELGIARFLGSVQGDEGKLILPDPAGGNVVDGSFAGGFRFAGLVVSFKDVQAHGVRGGIVQNQGEKIELQDGVKAFGKFVKQGFEVALLRDSFADFEKRFKLPARMFQARGGRSDACDFLRVLHEFQNSIRFGGVTTGRTVRETNGLRILGCAAADRRIKRWHRKE